MTKAGLLRVLGLLSVFAFSQTACGDDEPSPFTCGDDLTCTQGQVCVHGFNVKDLYRCVKNPCGLAQLSCDCAESVCEVGFCSSVSEHQVNCVCVNC